jgi:hypothetical protein
MGAKDMDLPEIYLEKAGQIFLSPVSGQERASRRVSHSNYQGINGRNGYTPVSYFDVILGGQKMNRIVRWRESIEAFEVSFSEGKLARVDQSLQVLLHNDGGSGRRRTLFQEFIQYRAFSTIDAFEVVNENACVEQKAFSIHAFRPLSFSQGHPASETCLYAL